MQRIYFMDGPLRDTNMAISDQVKLGDLWKVPIFKPLTAMPNDDEMVNASVELLTYRLMTTIAEGEYVGVHQP